MSVLLWGSETLVNTEGAGAQTESSVTGLKSGGFVVCWMTGDGAAQTVKYQLFNADGSALGPELDVSAGLFSVGGRSLPSVAALSSGGFVVTFDTGDGFAGAGVYNAAGVLQSIYAPGNTGGSPVSTDRPVTVAAAFSTATVFESEADLRIEVRQDSLDPSGSVTLAGLLTTPPSAIGEDNIDPEVAWNGIEGLAVWREAGVFAPGLKLREFSSTAVLGSEILVVSDTGTATTGFTYRNAATGFLTNQPTGNKMLLAYEEAAKPTKLDGTSNTSILFGARVDFAIYDMASNAVTPLTQTILDASQPRIFRLPDGRNAVAYVETTLFADGRQFFGDIKLQMIDANGNFLGNAFTINTAQSGSTFDPQFAVLADGRIVVTWTAEGLANADGDSSGIMMQILDPRDGIVEGTLQAETLLGHDILADQLRGFAGDDVISGLGGADQAFGGDGNDIINGGRGDDSLYGGNGVDEVRGGGGEDFVAGEAGNDVLRGGNGDDELIGGGGNDKLYGDAGADIYNGGAGTADIADYNPAKTGITAALDGSLTGTGEALGDTFIGIERLLGSAFDDVLRGDGSANVMNGRNGNDRIEGLAGADGLAGGAGNDAFRYTTQADGGDNIVDFSSEAAGNNDRFEFSAPAFGLPVGAFLAEQFQSDVSNIALTSTVRFFYETDTRILRFDADGSGVGLAVAIATLQAGATMTVSDIVIV